MVWHLRHKRDIDRFRVHIHHRSHRTFFGCGNLGSPVRNGL
jgi:hypothetical protein